MWISKRDLQKKLKHEYTRGWNHGHIDYKPPQDYTEWADGLMRQRQQLRESGNIPGSIPIPDYIVNAFMEED
uniref:Uncharacterized protein n=1 Tax=viral metagenome TaxID=1070528 RepID=A0A6M3Y2F9_9ZZZZ